MSVRPILVRLSDIREEIAGIRELTRGATAESFAANRGMTRAVQHALLIIAEAAKHIPADRKAEHPSIPWREIHGLGNMLRHEYMRIDPGVLWSVVIDDLDELDAAVSALLAGCLDLKEGR